MLNQHLWVGKINEARNVKEFGLHPEGIGDFVVLQVREVTRSDLHFGKVSLRWEGGPGCREAGKAVGADEVFQVRKMESEERSQRRKDRVTSSNLGIKGIPITFEL